MVVVDAKVVPRSKKRCLVWDGHLLTVKLTSPPEKGKANKELISFLEAALHREVAIVSGHKSRRKRISIEGEMDEIKRLLAGYSCQ